MNWNPPVQPSTTTGGACSYCGKSYTGFGVHGQGICDVVPRGEVRYLGVTPEQIRNIVRDVIREELRRHAESELDGTR
jgi:hypothetical protein